MEEANPPLTAHDALDALRALFDADLARVSFPDITAASLRDAADSLETERLALVEAEAAVRSAREALEQSRVAYERLGRRALAYARIYAEGDDVLGAKLGAIARGLDGVRTEPTADAPRKRGRPRKTDASLFEVEPTRARPSEADASEPAVDDDELLAESA